MPSSASPGVPARRRCPAPAAAAGRASAAGRAAVPAGSPACRPAQSASSIIGRRCRCVSCRMRPGARGTSKRAGRPARRSAPARPVARQRGHHRIGHVADIDRLEPRLAAPITGMNGSMPRHAGEPVEELVLRPEHDRRAAGSSALGKAARTACLARRLGRAHSRLGLAGSAPIAEICTSRATPAAAASRAMRAGALGVDALKSPPRRSARMPTRLTTSVGAVDRAARPSPRSSTRGVERHDLARPRPSA